MVQTFSIADGIIEWIMAPASNLTQTYFSIVRFIHFCRNVLQEHDMEN